MSKRITPFASRYCSTLDRLKEAIRRKRPGLLRRGVVLQPDNAALHSANLTKQWLHAALRRMAFETEDDLISELRNWFDNLDVDFFRVGINSLLPCSQKRIDLQPRGLR
ncbi:histone-lysine N-methyltransferase SETMAR [Plakobranchus ocellatus]|uniref:Histone-lysine N-methyltransferase SETMAR n=1 Tax=Plakobranchus ocellatus TaxID=259542 RepID=A0AAV4AD58_9GAST|nr:histone-lysine N-methyltransferase SETMAR [Plakobranchus ocellatus]